MTLKAQGLPNYQPSKSGPPPQVLRHAKHFEFEAATLRAGYLAALLPTELYDTSLERPNQYLFGFKRPRT